MRRLLQSTSTSALTDALTLRTRVLQEAEERASVDAAREQAIMTGNPLMAVSEAVAMSTGVKRRWDDDVVFRNQTRGAPKPTKRFINDSIRNDFHKKFLTKYIK